MALVSISTMEPSRRHTNALAVYGSMRPGGSTHWVVLDIDGTWVEGHIFGWLFEVTWGDAQGHPGVVLDPIGQRIAVSVLRSGCLERHWHQIDDFEGVGYHRVLTTVELDDGQIVEAFVYEALQNSPD